LNRIQQRSQNNLDELNRQEGIRSGRQKVVASSEASHLPPSDPFTPLKHAVVRLWPTFTGSANLSVETIGTGFVVRRQGDRAWIATALHVVTDLDGGAPAKTVEAKLYTGTLPAGQLPPRLQVVMDQPPEGIDQPILLEVRGLPPDIHPLALAPTQAQGTLTVVGHPSDRAPWTVAYALMTFTEQALLLDGGLESGASGSPVLSISRRVVGVVTLATAAAAQTSSTKTDLSSTAYQFQPRRGG
jgi:superkiller protein 3